MKELKIDKEDKFDYEAVVKKFVKALDSIKWLTKLIFTKKLKMYNYLFYTNKSKLNNV